MTTNTELKLSKYELSHTQKRFWFTEQLEFVQASKVNALSHVSTAFTLKGKLDREVFHQVINTLVSRHDILRTCFREEDGTPVQVVFSDIDYDTYMVDMSQQDTSLQELVMSELNKPFRLTEAPLIRITLYKLSESEHMCLLVAHHIIADGWAIDILMSEFATLYRSMANKQPNPLVPLAIQYSDFAHWHNELLEGGELDEQRKFWLDRLAGELPDLNFPLDFPRPLMQKFDGDTVPLVIDGELMEKLKKTCEKLDVSMYMFLLASFQVLLAKYTRNKDIIVGTSLSGRVHPEVADLVGCFINTLPVRNEVNGSELFTDFVKRVKQTVLELYANQEYPFDRIVEELGIERNLSRNPVFDAVFELHTLRTDKQLEVEVTKDLSLSFEKSLDHIEYSGFDFVFELFQTEGKIDGYIQYSTSLFRKETIERLSRHFIQLVAQVVERPEQNVCEIDMLLEEEKNQVLKQFHSSKEIFPIHVPLQTLFEEQVAKTPGHIAVSFEGEELSYQELNERANRMAYLLRSQRIGANQFVAVVSERNPDWVVTMLAIFKSGAAYVPIDPNLPDERIAYILQNSESRAIVTQNAFVERLLSLQIDQTVQTMICLDAEMGHSKRTGLYAKGDLNQCSSDNLDPINTSMDLAYMIYTSGSTGKPKGALVRHDGMINHLYSKITSLSLGAGDVVVQNASISFDVSVWQSLVALLVGAKTSIASFEVSRDQALLFEHLQKEGVTIVETVPSLLFAFLDTVKGLSEANRQLPKLRWMIANGEELPIKLVNSWFDLYPTIKLINAYGPTECSDDVTQHVMTGVIDAEQLRVPIGQPLPNMILYVVDQYHHLAPVGVKGEIWISGIGVGDGYWKNEALTKEKFISNPFAEDWTEERAYRTGDLGRWLPDGSIEFFSRIDFQVKVRGFRIELGEIESAIGNHSQVDEVAVIVKQTEAGDNTLVAFYTSKQLLGSSDLQEYLRGILPYYMVPALVLRIDSMPLLTSEKIDRHALRAWEIGEGEKQRVSGLHTKTEIELASIWQDILELNQIDAGDNFFQLGGHSINAVKVINRIRDRFQIKMTLQQIFITPELSELAGVIDIEVAKKSDLEEKHDLSLQRMPKQELYELAPVQLPEWYMHHFEPDNPFYNTSFDLMFHGDMDLQVFERVWQTLMSRHAVLRTTFKNENGIPLQIVAPSREMRLSDLYEDYSHIAEDQIPGAIKELAEAHANQIFDFERGPLFSTKLVELPGKQFLYMFASHHIIWDETSSMNLMKEFKELYNAYITGRQPQLPTLEVEYTDYVQWMNRLVKEGHLENQRQYWLKQFSNVPPGLDLPTDYPRPPMVTFNGGTILGRFDPGLQKQMVDFCQQNDITLNMFLLTVLNLQLHRLSGQSDFVVGSPILNRDDVKLESMLGLFATALPLRCTIEPDMTFEQLLAHSKQTSIEAYDHHAYPSNFVIEQIEAEVDLSRTKLFSVMYGLQNNKQRLMDEIQFEGLQCNFRVYDFIERNSRFDLTFVFDELESGLEINLNYNSDLFTKSTAEQISQQFIWLAEQVVSAPGKQLQEYALVSESEKQQMNEWNQTENSSEGAMCLHEMIERQAAKTPENPAILYNETTLSYRELNEKANRLAHWLTHLGVKPEDKVGITFEPSTDMMVALIAVLKAGAAYVPLSPEVPISRQQMIIQRAGIDVILTESQYVREDLLFQGKRIIVDVDGSLIDKQSNTNLNLSVSSSTLAYVLFTSGTTGMPKGIEIEHRGIINLFEWSQSKYPLSDSDATLFMTPYTFDASLLEIFWPLTQGAKVVIPEPAERKSPASIGKLVKKHQITILQFVPILLEAFVTARKNGDFENLPSLRYVICGGALLTRELCDQFKSQFSCRLSNHYGPTEITVDAITFDCDEPYLGNAVPIGRPIHNVKVYLLDEFMNRVPVGVRGEIYIDSPGLARGYLHDPAMTDQYFVPNPFTSDVNARLYKTGDVAKYVEDGNIVYLGRIDHQVKVRGNRVELEEVESWLASHERVSSCVVIHKKDERMDGLVAYVEMKSESPVLQMDGEGLKLYTLSQIPSLQDKMNELHFTAWPEFFSGEEVLREYWPQLFTQFTEYQLALVDGLGEVVAVGNAIPIYWEGTKEHLPQGWDEALIKGFTDAKGDQKPNTLLVLAGVVNTKYQGKGLATLLVKAFKMLAHGHGLQSLIVPVRPTGKNAYTDLDFSSYCELRREDGLPVDNWLRSHERVGGKILQIAHKSQYVKASVVDWQRWAGTIFEESGSYEVEKALSPVHIDLEQGIGEYWDPSVWVEHPLDSAQTWNYVDSSQLESYLKEFMPEYMVPQQYVFVTQMPLMTSGKIDKNRLPKAYTLFAEREFILPKSQTEEEILNIWREILQMESISVTDSFFDLGGHSLKAAQIVSQISKKCRVSFSIRELFEFVTIRKLAQVVDEKRDMLGSDKS
ncbi:amino acid adenylation domain-containing protein [Thermoactinomyces sp. DSM 45891]|uniref:non-ribosomal peptide synthetase n=1 Tax=Thermoactinomyces sp. DSM 45891 TaxID=1761907 RepID=UPI000914D371|nr:non-ribosomal peptide synthetase [Thermoactinomyces sp. DSM 45891]SFX57556.1 amino acid adenylation domain-containing protein [Thermoactinomyces sp. DSM 45891]